jgi:hypothetical protein
MQSPGKGGTPRAAQATATVAALADEALRTTSTAGQQWQSRSPALLSENSASAGALQLAASAAGESVITLNNGGSLPAEAAAVAAAEQRALLVMLENNHPKQTAGAHIHFKFPDGGVG